MIRISYYNNNQDIYKTPRQHMHFYDLCNPINTHNFQNLKLKKNTKIACEFCIIKKKICQKQGNATPLPLPD